MPLCLKCTANELFAGSVSAESHFFLFLMKLNRKSSAIISYRSRLVMTGGRITLRFQEQWFLCVSLTRVFNLNHRHHNQSCVLHFFLTWQENNCSATHVVATCCAACWKRSKFRTLYLSRRTEKNVFLFLLNEQSTPTFDPHGLIFRSSWMGRIISKSECSCVCRDLKCNNRWRKLD